MYCHPSRKPSSPLFVDQASQLISLWGQLRRFKSIRQVFKKRKEKIMLNDFLVVGHYWKKDKHISDITHFHNMHLST